jgi:hypothetical protein
MLKRHRQPMRFGIANANLRTICLLFGSDYHKLARVSKQFQAVVSAITSNQEDCELAYPNHPGVLIASRFVYPGTKFALYAKGTAIFPCCEILITPGCQNSVQKLLVAASNKLPISVWGRLLAPYSYLTPNQICSIMVIVLVKRLITNRPWSTAVWKLILASESTVGLECVKGCIRIHTNKHWTRKFANVCDDPGPPFQAPIQLICDANLVVSNRVEILDAIRSLCLREQLDFSYLPDMLRRVKLLVPLHVSQHRYDQMQATVRPV